MSRIENLKSQFPSSLYTSELNLIMGAILVKQLDFESAITALNKASVEDPETPKLLQQAYYGAGINAYKKFDYALAASHFTASAKIQYESAYQQASLFWLLNAHYKNADYCEAHKYFIDCSNINNDYIIPTNISKNITNIIKAIINYSKFLKKNKIVITIADKERPNKKEYYDAFEIIRALKITKSEAVSPSGQELMESKISVANSI